MVSTLRERLLSVLQTSDTAAHVVILTAAEYYDDHIADSPAQALQALKVVAATLRDLPEDQTVSADFLRSLP